MRTKKKRLPLEPIDTKMAPDLELQEDELLQQIVCGLHQMEYPEPPPDFSASVMAAVRSRKTPWWRRAYRWARSPHTVTITPLRMIPAAALLIASLVSTVYFSREGAQVARSRVGLQEGITVTFTLRLPEAKSVDVVGSFNDWSPRRCEMHRTDDNATWSVVIGLPAGRYEYAFLVDGTRIVFDPDGELYQDDGFGNRNNVLVVGTNHEKAI